MNKVFDFFIELMFFAFVFSAAMLCITPGLYLTKLCLNMLFN